MLAQVWLKFGIATNPYVHMAEDGGGGSAVAETVSTDPPQREATPWPPLVARTPPWRTDWRAIVEHTRIFACVSPRQCRGEESADPTPEPVAEALRQRQRQCPAALRLLAEAAEEAAEIERRLLKEAGSWWWWEYDWWYYWRTPYSGTSGTTGGTWLWWSQPWSVWKITYQATGQQWLRIVTSDGRHLVGTTLGSGF